MVVTQLDAPYVLVWVVVVWVYIVKAVTTLPDAFPIVELVSGSGLLGLVLDTELHAVS